jgi:hypothetical protein
MTDQELAALASLTTDQVVTVYSGRAGKCCCGCAGNHRVNSKHAALATERRGYAHDPKDVNDRQVAKVLGLVRANAKDAEAGMGNFSVVLENRLYVVYTL